MSSQLAFLQKALISLSIFALICRFLDLVCFNSRPPAHSEAESRFSKDDDVQHDWERQLAAMDALDAELKAAHGHSHGYGIDEDEGGSAVPAPPPRRPRGAPPPPPAGGAEPLRLSDQEAKAQWRRFADSAFVKNVLGSEDEELLGASLGFAPE